MKVPPVAAVDSKVRKPRVAWRFGVLIAVVFGATVATACSGGGANDGGAPLSPDEYFGRLSAASQGLQQAARDSAKPPPAEAFGDPSELLAFFREAMIGLEEAHGDFIRDVEELNPPDELAEAHQTFLEALRTDQERLSGLADEMGQAEGIEEATAILKSFGGVASASRGPCLQLREMAQGLGIDTELDCGQ